MAVAWETWVSYMLNMQMSMASGYGVLIISTISLCMITTSRNDESCEHLGSAVSTTVCFCNQNCGQNQKLSGTSALSVQFVRSFVDSSIKARCIVCSRLWGFRRVDATTGDRDVSTLRFAGQTLRATLRLGIMTCQLFVSLVRPSGRRYNWGS